MKLEHLLAELKDWVQNPISALRGTNMEDKLEQLKLLDKLVKEAMTIDEDTLNFRITI